MTLELTHMQLEAAYASARLLRAVTDEVAGYFRSASSGETAINPVMDQVEITGRPVRRVVTRSQKSTRGYFPSVKNDQIIPWELENELGGLYILDCSPYCFPPLFAQPLTLQYLCPWKNQMRKATPDFFYRAGPTVDALRPTLLEVVDDKTASNPEERRTFELLEYIFGRMGVDYRIWLAKEIRGQVLENAKWLARFNRIQLGDRDRLHLHEVFGAQPSVSLSSVAKALGADGEVKAFAMLLHCWLLFDQTTDVRNDPVVWRRFASEE